MNDSERIQIPMKIMEDWVTNVLKGSDIEDLVPSCCLLGTIEEDHACSREEEHLWWKKDEHPCWSKQNYHFLFALSFLRLEFEYVISQLPALAAMSVQCHDCLAWQTSFPR